MGPIAIAACSALFVWLAVGIPAKILKHISVLHAANDVPFPYHLELGRDTAGTDRYQSTSVSDVGVIAPLIASLSLLGFSAAINSGMQ